MRPSTVEINRDRPQLKIRHHHSCRMPPYPLAAVSTPGDSVRQCAIIHKIVGLHNVDAALRLCNPYRLGDLSRAVGLRAGPGIGVEKLLELAALPVELVGVGRCIALAGDVGPGLAVGRIQLQPGIG